MAKVKVDERAQYIAVALCTEDGQRHRPMQFRDGTPCRGHEYDGWTAAQAAERFVREREGR